MQRVAVVGLGFMGKTHAIAYSAIESAELAKVVDVQEEVAREVAQEHGAEPATFDDVLADDSISIVDICLPTDMHREYTIRALEAGKHVLCEKPMARTVEDARAMAEAAAASDKFLMIAHVLRFWPEYELFKRRYDAGEFGAIRQLACRRLSPRPKWSWDSWITDESRSGSALLDLHIHDIDWVAYICGRPKAVTARAVRNETGWCHVYCTYEFENDVVAFAEGGWDMPPSFPFNMAFCAICEKGVYVYDSGKDPAVSIFREGAEEPEHPEIEPVVAAGAAAGGNISELGGYYLECKYFVECVESGTPPTVVTPEQALQDIEIAFAELQSVNERTTVSL